MLIEVDKDIWFDNEKVFIILGNDNKNKYAENYNDYPVIKEKKNKNWYPTLVFLASIRCNLQCKYCFAHDGTYDIDDEKTKIGFEEFKKTFDYFYNTYGHINAISFFGGEPMIDYKEIEKFCAYLFDNYNKDERPLLGINSNGTIMNEEIKNMIAKYGINFGTSLDGIKIHNDIQRIGKGINSVYDKVKHTLNYLSDIPINKVVQFTVSRVQIENYQKGDYHKWMQEIGNMGVHFTEIVPVSTEDKRFKIDLENFEIRKNFEILCEDIFDYTISKISDDENSMMNCPRTVIGILVRIMRREYQNDCSAGRSFSITPQGYIFPCHSFALDKRYGVNFDNDFSSSHIDNNEHFQKVKNASREDIEKCKTCIGAKICPFYCRGLSYSMHNNMQEVLNERCFMMDILVRKCICYLVGEEFKTKRKTVVSNLVKYHQVMELYKG